MRADLTLEIPPGRIASSTSASGASRTASQLADGARAAPGRRRRGCDRWSIARGRSAPARRSGGRAAPSAAALDRPQAFSNPYYSCARGWSPRSCRRGCSLGGVRFIGTTASGGPARVTRRAPATLRRVRPWGLATRGPGGRLPITAPPSPDLAAATYRSHLSPRVGFSLRDNAWYAARPLPLRLLLLSPALGALIGPLQMVARSRWSPPRPCSRCRRGVFAPRGQWRAARWFAVRHLFSCFQPRPSTSASRSASDSVSRPSAGGRGGAPVERPDEPASPVAGASSLVYLWGLTVLAWALLRGLGRGYRRNPCAPIASA